MSLILTTPIAIGGFALFIALKEENLSQSLIGVNQCGKRSGVGNLQSDVSLPFRFEGRHVDDDSATGIGRFSQADGKDGSGDLDVFDAASESKGVGRDDAAIGFDVDKGSIVEIFRVDHRTMDIGEDFELVRHPEVIAIA